ncbi:hypothetical protein QTN25_008451 [Entamoeba marina]
MEHKFKVCVFGSQGSGKTSLIRRLITDYYFEAMQQEQTCMKKKYTIEDVEVEMLVYLIGTKNDVDPEIEENEACVLASDLSLHYRNVSSKTSDGFKQLHEELEKDITATLHKRMESTEKGKTKKK